MASSAEWWLWYNAYLDSKEWAAFRLYALDWHGRRCAKCRRKERKLEPFEWLEIDHLTYERVGRELVTDVQVLCNTCHRKKTRQDRRRRRVRRWLRV
jgi:5-methylcytosine-specific restriction endonuclease McrA